MEEFSGNSFIIHGHGFFPENRIGKVIGHSLEFFLFEFCGWAFLSKLLFCLVLSEARTCQRNLSCPRRKEKRKLEITAISAAAEVSAAHAPKI